MKGGELLSLSWGKRDPVRALGVCLLGSIVLTIGLTGCGSSSSDDSTAATVAASERFTIPVKGTPPFRYEEEVRRKEDPKTGLLGDEPRPIIPDRPAPDFLVVQDLIEGIGQVAFLGREPETLTVQYVGYDYETRQKFASSWDQGKPLTFTLGAGGAIKGWEEALDGIETGDRREFIVPPALASGGPIPGNIPEGSTLVFVVDLLRATE